LVALIACVVFSASRKRTADSGQRTGSQWPVASGQCPGSSLKAGRGVDAGFREALESHAKLDGTFELLCGVRDPNDPAVEAIRSSPRGRAIVCSTVTLNQK